MRRLDFTTGVLVADDDAQVLHLVGRTLLESGYAPILTSDGQEALARLGQRDYLLAIVDLVMPRMNGAILVRHIRATQPTLPVILITAYPSHPAFSGVQHQPNVRCLLKPFGPGALRHVVKESLGSPSLAVDADPRD